MGQEDTEIAFDLAIYVKAKEIQWRSANKFSEVVIRMGTFHIASNFFAIIGRSTQTWALKICCSSQRCMPLGRHRY